MSNPKMAFCVATMQPAPTIPAPVLSFTIHSTTGLMPDQVLFRRNTSQDNLGVIGSYNWLYEHTEADVVAYVHDDVVCQEDGWDERVTEEFKDPRVGVVGFGGALGHGHEDLYKVPYRLDDLARHDYRSNTEDAESHGQRFDGACDVAVLDGFALFVRRVLLDRSGGWPRALRFHCYDYAICCLARRYGYTVRLVGVRCHHLGGRTSTTKDYQQWAAKHGLPDAEDHQRSHRFIYEHFRDVLPWRVR